MYTELQSIKEQLFDAPVEVKKAFNSIVGYFDTEYFGKAGYDQKKVNELYEKGYKSGFTVALVKEINKLELGNESKYLDRIPSDYILVDENNEEYLEGFDGRSKHERIYSEGKYGPWVDEYEFEGKKIYSVMDVASRELYVPKSFKGKIKTQDYGKGKH